MKILTSLALAASLGLVGACTINPHSMDMTQAVQSARSASDHQNLAKHYEEAAKEMQAKADEHKKLLAQYEANKEDLWEASFDSNKPLPRIDSYLRSGRKGEFGYG